MPDISMCFGGKCTMRSQCARFLADPNPYRQSYMATPPLKPEGGCDSFYDITKGVPFRLVSYKDAQAYSDDYRTVKNSL